MKKIKLILGTYNCRPLGTTDEVLEEDYQESLKPFLTLLYNYPKIPIVLHYSGIVLEWLESRHPEFIMLLNEMVSRRQVEFLGGGFYEPVFPLIPANDRLGQIELLTTYIRKRFRKRPRGGWIAERIWEPSMASTLKNSGMEYIFLEDQHFLSAGLFNSDLYKPCITEDQGKTLTVFPIATQLLEMMQQGPPEDLAEECFELASYSEQRVIALMSDGYVFNRNADGVPEKFNRDWFQAFLDIIMERRRQLQPVLAGKFLRLDDSIKKKAYFPCVSSEEMNGSMLIPSQKKKLDSLRSRARSYDKKIYVNAGFFRQFLTRYEESNALYSKMIYTHSIVNQIRGDRSRKKTAREELWKGQCHNIYWHGDSGAIYENRLRKTAYGNLIEAEKISREKGIFKPSVVITDFDMDGYDEYLFQGHYLNGYVHRIGGKLFELDYLPSNWNYMDTMARHKELYHVEEKGPFVFDTYSRRSFLDHFLNPSEGYEDFHYKKYRELGNFIKKVFSVDEVSKDQKQLILSSLGRVGFPGKTQTVKLTKKYRFQKNQIYVGYTIENLHDQTLKTCFAPEINLSLAGRDEFAMYRLNAGGEEAAIEQVYAPHGVCTDLLVHDTVNKVGITISYENECQVWVLPIETNTLKNGKFYNMYQGTCFLNRWLIDLPAGGKWESSITLKVERK